MDVKNKILRDLEAGQIVMLKRLKEHTTVPRVWVSRLRMDGHPIYAVRDGKRLIGWVYPDAGKW